MTKDVVVTVKGVQFVEEADEIVTICEGEYFEMKDSAYVVYEELPEGHDKPILNRIKIQQNEVMVTKKGPYQVQMPFKGGAMTRTQYITPFGGIMLEFDTKEVKVSDSDDKIDILIRYGLTANEQFVADCEININIRAKK